MHSVNTALYGMGHQVNGCLIFGQSLTISEWIKPVLFSLINQAVNIKPGNIPYLQQLN